jgi:phage tail-like protein
MLMRPPLFAHVTGQAMWRRCDHDRTRLLYEPVRAALAPREADPVGAAEPEPWLAVRGAAAVLPCPPDLCADGEVLLVDRELGLLALSPDGWRSLAAPRSPPQPLPGPLEFAPVAPPGPPPQPVSLARDAAGRVWLLETNPAALKVLGPNLSISGSRPISGGFAVAAANWGVAVADGDRLLAEPYGGLWREIELPAPAIALTAHPEGAAIAALLDDGRVALLRTTGLSVHDLPEMGEAVFLLATGPDTLLAGQPTGPPGATAECRFVAYRLDPEVGPVAQETYAVRGFDGRGLWVKDGVVHASTAAGARSLYGREAPLETEGVIETYALDSAVFACTWHRVFLDVCAPPGTMVSIEARTADELPPEPARRTARKPADMAEPPLDNPHWPPLVGLSADEGGWSPLTWLDARAPMADIPDPPARLARPSEDPLALNRSDQEPPWPTTTLEGLIAAPPGRYLWLRLRLTGRERRTPTVLALRASYPRPSLLELLPSYWRADAATADPTERALALFEGWTTEIDAQITALRRFADPRLVPPEALEWLASYVALTFDQRVGEPVRRQLLSEIAWLYERRGTVVGLERLLSILAQGPANIVEGFRLRRTHAAYLGQESSAVIGPALQLGGDEGEDSASLEPEDHRLSTLHLALQLRRQAERVAGRSPCPAEDPPAPIEADPYARFVRRFAHRFTVVLPVCRTDVLAGVISDAIEANKPAHTVHRLCWLDSGFRLGPSSLVGLARLGERGRFDPALLGEAVLGRADTIGRPSPDPRFHLGATALRQGGALS